MESVETMLSAYKPGSARLFSICPETQNLYEQFAQTLTTVDDFFTSLNSKGIALQPADFATVDMSRLSIAGGIRLPGLNETHCVRIGKPLASETPTCSQVPPPSRFATYVFKGANFPAWVVRRQDQEEPPPWEVYKRALYGEHSLRHELTVLCHMPPHANIIPRPPILVTTPTEPRRVCGFLQPFRGKQTVAEQIRLANVGRVRIPLETKRKWCLGIVEGILHAHRAGGMFHMDMKPGNVLVEDDGSVRIIDWQQMGMCRATHPPEATLGSYPKVQKIVDKMRLDQDGQPFVVFTPRPDTWPEDGLRDAYVKWKEENPRGIEAAEVFMVARTMWHILEQREETTDAAVWGEESEDVPESWREAVESCLVEDPAERPTLETVVEFWRGQVEAELPKDDLP